MVKLIPATEIKHRLGRYLDTAQTEPVTVVKSGREYAVILSHTRYEELIEVEREYLKKRSKRNKT